MVAGCTNVLWYWSMGGIGSKKIPVNGFNLFEITPEKQIADMYVEFNNIGWGIDIGFTTYNRSGSQLPTAEKGGSSCTIHISTRKYGYAFIILEFCPPTNTWEGDFCSGPRILGNRVEKFSVVKTEHT